MSPMDRTRYPKDWTQISAAIRARAGDRCEFCGVPNGAFIQRKPNSDRYHELSIGQAETAGLEGERVTLVVLTVAHLDHDPMNSDPANLRALCQRCHLRYDREQHARTAAETRRRKREAAGQLAFGETP